MQLTLPRAPLLTIGIQMKYTNEHIYHAGIQRSQKTTNVRKKPHTRSAPLHKAGGHRGAGSAAPRCSPGVSKDGAARGAAPPPATRANARRPPAGAAAEPPGQAAGAAAAPKDKGGGQGRSARRGPGTAPSPPQPGPVPRPPPARRLREGERMASSPRRCGGSGGDAPEGGGKGEMRRRGRAGRAAQPTQEGLCVPGPPLPPHPHRGRARLRAHGEPPQPAPGSRAPLPHLCSARPPPCPQLAPPARLLGTRAAPPPALRAPLAPHRALRPPLAAAAGPAPVAAGCRSSIGRLSRPSAAACSPIGPW